MHIVILAPGAQTRVPVLECAQALDQKNEVTRTDVLSADSDSDIDSALFRIGIGAKRIPDTETRLIVAGGDGVLRAVLRRMVRHELTRQRTTRTADSTSTDRRAGLATDRTIADFPAIGLLPLAKAGELPDLARSLDVPDDPATVADMVVAGQSRRLDLFRNDRGSLTLHGALIGGVVDDRNGPGRLVVHAARINVDDTVLCDETAPLLACAIVNAAGYSRMGEIPLVKEADPSSGKISVGVAIGEQNGIEVRRISGRTVRVSPVPAPDRAQRAPEGDNPGIPFTDDGVDGVLRHVCTWWVERGAWGLYMR